MTPAEEPSGSLHDRDLLMIESHDDVWVWQETYTALLRQICVQFWHPCSKHSSGHVEVMISWCVIFTVGLHSPASYFNIELLIRIATRREDMQNWQREASPLITKGSLTFSHL